MNPEAIVEQVKEWHKRLNRRESILKTLKSCYAFYPRKVVK